MKGGRGEMITEYKLSPKYLPTERQVWLMSKQMEKDGHECGMAVMRGFEKGEFKYIDHTLYRLCRGCMEYYPISTFVDNKRYPLGKHYLCNDCMSRERRIRKFGVLDFMTDVGMTAEPINVRYSLKDKTKALLMRRLAEDNGNEIGGL